MESVKLLLPEGNTLELEKGKPLLDVLPQRVDDKGRPFLAARVNGRVCSLNHAPLQDCQVEFLSYASSHGRIVYRRTLSFVLYMAVAELYRNARLVIGQSLANGFYYDLFLDIPVSHDVLQTIREKMIEIIRRDQPFREFTMSRHDATAYFSERAMHDKVMLLKHCDLETVTIAENGRFYNVLLYPLAPTTGFVPVFELKTYHPGFVLQFPDAQDFQVRPETWKYTKLFHIFQESKDWGKILTVNNVGRLNHLIREGGVSDLIKIAESLHEKKIASLADAICARRESVRLILVAGPSASGKTTFSKRLAIHLRVNGLRPMMLSMDNYFVDRDMCPRDEEGNFDFEALEALDISLFNEQLAELLAGREVLLPHFNFESGKREFNHTRMHMEDDQVLIVEGIHGLNERLTSAIPASSKFKIYISALTQLSIDDHNHISTTDTRMLRRIIRDRNYRGYSAGETLKRFPSVIRGEEKYIFPFQENADAMFNSALVYELAVLKKYAEPLLKGIPADDSTHAEACRLTKFLELFLAVPDEELPPTSILREFIGGSSFDY